MTNLNSRRIVSLLFIATIAVVFTLSFGPASQTGCGAPTSSGEANTAATVNGKEIPMMEFRRAYRDQLNMYRQQGITEELARQIGLHRQVLDNLINQELTAQAAERNGIQPSDEELADLIHKAPIFQKDGQFDPTTYRNAVRQFFQKTPERFEDQLRRQMAGDLLLSTVAESATVSEDEVRAQFLKEGNKASLTFARFTPSMFADKVPAPTADQLAQFKKEREDAIKANYEQNKFLYHQPEQIKARHILIGLPNDAPADRVKEAQEKAANLRKQLVDEKKDFAELAKQFSEDPGSREKGGDLGWAGADAYVKPFSDAAFALKPGEISQPVQTQFGIHLIQLEEKRPPKSQELSEVSDEIAKQLWNKEKAKDVAKAEAESALAQVKAGKSIAELFPAPPEEETRGRFTEPTKPEATETGEFSAAASTIPKLGAAPELLPDVFKGEGTGPLDRVYPAGDAFVIAQVTTREKPADAAFDADKEKLTAQARQAKQMELRDSYVKALREKGDVKVNDEAIEDALGPGGES